MVIRNGGAPGRGIYKIIWAPLGALPLNRRRWGRRDEWSNLGQKRDSKSNVPFWSLHFLSAPSFPRNPQHSAQTPTVKTKNKKTKLLPLERSAQLSGITSSCQAFWKEAFFSGMRNFLQGSLGLSLLIAGKYAICLFCLHFDVLNSYPHSSLSNLKTDLHFLLVPTVESELLTSFHEYLLIKGQDLLVLLFA